MRTVFTESIDRMRGDVVGLASYVSKTLVRATDALVAGDETAAAGVLTGRDELHMRRVRLERDCQRLLILQQPVAAHDLRFVLSVVYIAGELERMGEHALSVARRAVMPLEDRPLAVPASIRSMAAVTVEMVDGVTAAFLAEDADLALQVAARDDEVDALDDQLFREMLQAMGQDSRAVGQATSLLRVSHDIERIADRVTNICERVVFCRTGVQQELSRAS